MFAQEQGCRAAGRGTTAVRGFDGMIRKDTDCFRTNRLVCSGIMLQTKMGG
jgi:hypothetical protein